MLYSCKMPQKHSTGFCGIFLSLKHNRIAHRSSKVSSRPDSMIFEIHQLRQSGFSRVYSNSCCSCFLKPEIIKIGQSSRKMYSNNILNFQESTTILKACTKKSGNILNAPCIKLEKKKSTDETLKQITSVINFKISISCKPLIIERSHCLLRLNIQKYSQLLFIEY